MNEEISKGLQIFIDVILLPIKLLIAMVSMSIHLVIALVKMRRLDINTIDACILFTIISMKLCIKTTGYEIKNGEFVSDELHNEWFKKEVEKWRL